MICYFPVIISMFVAGFGMYSDTAPFTASPGLSETDFSTGILDRVEDGEQAVIIIEDLEQERVVPMDTLPPGSKVNMWFDVKMNEERFEVIRINYGATIQALNKVRAGQEKLRE